MKTITKILTVVLMLSMLISVFAACDNGKDNGKTPTGNQNNGSVEAPTSEPTKFPVDQPTESPMNEPTEAPTAAPTEAPTDAPEIPTAPPIETDENGVKYQLDWEASYYTVTDVGDKAWVVIPETFNGTPVTKIDSHVGNDNTTSITIPASITTIMYNAFGQYRIVEVINHSSVEIKSGYMGAGEVAKNAFEVHDGDSKIVDLDGYLFYTYEGVNYLVNYIGDETEIVLPESFNGESYVINKYAFYGKTSLTSVTIPEGVTAIGDNAFWLCSALEYVEIPTTVKSIGKNAFYKCSESFVVNFKETRGWYITEEENGEIIKRFVESDLYYFPKGSPYYSYASTYLSTAYVDYYWYNSEE